LPNDLIGLARSNVPLSDRLSSDATPAEERWPVDRSAVKVACDGWEQQFDADSSQFVSAGWGSSVSLEFELREFPT